MRELSVAEYSALLQSRRAAVVHTMMFHDDRCAIYDGDACNCRPDVRYFTDTNA
jgi:hypothetical protein